MGMGGLPSISFNSTTRVEKVYTAGEKILVLPHSDKPLTKQGLEDKISGLQKRVDDLSSQIQNMILSRNTHGGKNFRGKKFTLGEQKDRALEQLDFLKKVKDEHFPKKKPEWDKHQGWYPL